MPSFPARLTAALFAVSCLSPAWAAGDPAQVPDPVQAFLNARKIDKFGSLGYADENGNQIDAQAFVAQLNAGKPVLVMKKVYTDGHEPDIVLRLTTREALAQMQQKPGKLKRGDAFPEFHLARLDGTAIDNKAFQGRYTLISFYFAECAPCVKEVPVLNELAARRKDVDYLAITFDSAAETRRFVEQHHLSWPIVTDARKLTMEAGVIAYPTMALIDSEGKLVAMEAGDKLSKEGAIDKWLDDHLPDGTD